MRIDIMMQIKNNDNYLRYLRENSFWYKILNRDPHAFADFIDQAKIDYRLRPVDRISDALSTLELLSKFVTAFK